MIIQTTYVFETKDGFRYERENADEILKIFEDNLKELEEIGNIPGNSVHACIDTRQDYMVHGTICLHMGYDCKYYELYTEIKVLSETNTLTTDK